MRSNAWQDTSRANWIDYLLCWLSSVFAVFSCGMAVNSYIVAGVGIGGVTIGLGISYFVRAKFGERIYPWVDGTLYCIVSWVAVISARSINAGVFPEDTFPIELTPSAWLLWMTIFGSFFCWRDGTIIFQAIPALAIFGFVGCYDTFRYVVFFFFGFLICFATMFARAHGRDMQDRAVQSGYFRLGQSHHLDPGEQSEALRLGPWRWAAGAEWALGSALIIVVLSLVGAPVIQATAKPLSGIVTVRAPRLRNATTAANPQNVPTTTSVGTGPMSLSDTPCFIVSGEVPEYLKTASFTVWNGRAWTVTDSIGKQLVSRETHRIVGPESPDAMDKLKFPNKRPGEYWDQYRSQLMSVRALLMTKEILQAGNDPNFNGKGTVDTSGPNLSLTGADRYEGTLNYDKVPAPNSGSNAPAIIDSSLLACLDANKPSGQILTLVKTVVKGIDNDYDKAVALQREITKRIKYNIKAEATPDNADPADYALFESHQGYCDIFATSMVKMARIANIPARYTIGYLPDPKNRDAQGTQTILESDRHAWAELYFENIGWVPFDPTEGADIVPGGGPRDNKPTDTAAILRMLGNTLNVLIGVAVLTGIVLYIRIRNLPKTAEMIRGELDNEYIQFISTIWRHSGNRRLLSETTDEYLIRVGDSLGPLREQAIEIGTIFTNLMFGPTEVQAADVDQARLSVRAFKESLSKQPKVKPSKLLENAVVHHQESS